jgi:glyoxylase-like metal-dependent hydrolase (beta-lactamase superfamily II)
MNAQATPRVVVRTYRHGLGDCHLVTLNAADGSKYRILIDCGVILGTPDAEARMTDVLENVCSESGGTVDLLVATHEHWDHLSGFLQAEESFKKLKVSNVWMSWIENPDDNQARQIKADQNTALQLVRSAALQLDSTATSDGHPLMSLLEFFGVAGRMTTAQALEAVRN